jgi:hypothetical protein
VTFRITIFPNGQEARRAICSDCECLERKARRREAREGGNIERVLFVPDSHHPNASESAWGLMLRAAKVFKPDTIVVLGDFADGESLSLHPPDEPGKRDFDDELGLVLKALTDLDGLGATKKVYLEGNHEQRLSRYLARNAPALYRSLSLPELLKLRERGWAWVPYRTSWKLGKLHLTHDTGSAGMNAHRASAKAFMGSTVIGHTHRMAYEVLGRFDDSPYVSAMFGWLGDTKLAARYLHEAKSAEWVHGFGVGYLDRETGLIFLQPVPIVDGACCVAGRILR